MKNMTKQLARILTITAIGAYMITALFVALPSHAAVSDINVSLQIPVLETKSITVCETTLGPDGKQLLECTGIAKYISTVYQWAIAFTAVLAVLAFTYAGVLWLIAGGDSGKVTESKKIMGNALIGFLLALGSYMLLNLINPNLVAFNALRVPGIATIDLDLTPAQESSEAVIADESKGMDCFYSTFGKTESDVSSQLATATLLGKNFQIHQKAKAAFDAAQAELQSAGVSYPITTIESFNWRPNVNNPKMMSLHSFGVAIDINPSTNPNKKPRPGGTCTNPPNCPQKCEGDLPDQFVSIMIKNGFRWGGYYKTVCDTMHFEFLGECKK
jgi:hypothetical protein